MQIGDDLGDLHRKTAVGWSWAGKSEADQWVSVIEISIYEINRNNAHEPNCDVEQILDRNTKKVKDHQNGWECNRDRFADHVRPAKNYTD